MREAYVEFASSVAVLFGADPVTAHGVMEDILTFETEIANVGLSKITKSFLFASVLAFLFETEIYYPTV